MVAAIRSSHITEGLARLLAIESRLRGVFDDLVCRAGDVPAARDLLNALPQLASGHAEAIRLRLLELRGPDLPARAAAACEHSPAPASPSLALEAAFVATSEGAIAYASFLPVTSRFRDSAISAHEGTTGHLARRHMQDYVAAMGRVAAAIQSVRLAELAAIGDFCQCVCPGCGIGICVCGAGAKAALGEAWMAARPNPSPGEVVLSQPRPRSAAAAVGIREGDVLVEVAGVALESMPQVQTTIRDAPTAQPLRVGIRRREEHFTLLLRPIPDIAGNGELPLDCEAPSGQAFYLDRARDLQLQLRRRARLRGEPGGVASLSPRETQVLRLLADGATNPMIAEKLGIRRPTVARHIATILSKLDATNRSEAAAMAAAAGLAGDI